MLALALEIIHHPIQNRAKTKMSDKNITEGEPKKHKISLQRISSSTGQVLRDLRQLQRERETLPDILYNYRLRDGRIVRKRPRRGSLAEDEVIEGGTGPGSTGEKNTKAEKL